MRRGRRSILTGPALAAAAARYRGGESTVALGASLGLSRQTVGNCLKRAGADMRDNRIALQAINDERRLPDMSPAELRLYRKLREGGIPRQAALAEVVSAELQGFKAKRNVRGWYLYRCSGGPAIAGPCTSEQAALDQIAFVVAREGAKK